MADRLAVVALIVSLIALLFTLVQLLAQIFATADGYRRCQPSVLGRWASLTNIRWRWTQFRFETLYSTPDILLEARNINKPGITWIEGTKNSFENTMTPSPDQPDLRGSSGELVSWISLLQVLHGSAAEAAKRVPAIGMNTKYSSWPAIIVQQRSWDFMVPEVVRPYASTTVSDIAIMARRVGMTWTDFRPGDGILRAEGGPHVLTSIEIRGVGILLQYKDLRARVPGHMQRSEKHWKDDHGSSNIQEMYIWTAHADRMLFGILPGNEALGIPDYEFGSDEKVFATLRELHGDNDFARNTLRGILNKNTGFYHGFCDLLPMAASMIRQRGSTVVQVFCPGYWAGLTYYQVCYLVYRERLENEIQNHEGLDQMRWLASQYDLLHQNHGKLWDGVNPDPRNGRTLRFLEDVHDAYDRTTEYFEEHAKQLNYLDLVKAHLVRAPLSFEDATRNVNKGKGREHFNTGDRPWRGEAMHMYFDYLPDVIRFMAECNCKDAVLVKEAWATLIFRAFCWQRCHHLDYFKGSPIPSEYYGSQLPVFIG